MKQKDYEFKINEEALQALFQGKRVIFKDPEKIVTLTPTRHGIFMPMDVYRQLERLAVWCGNPKMTELLADLFK